MTPTAAEHFWALAQFAEGWALSNPAWLILFGAVMAIVVIAAALALYFRLTDGADPELAARDAETERLFTTMPQPAELHHTRFVPPVGAGDPAWLPRTGGQHRAPRRAAGVTPKRQPARAGAPDPGAATGDCRYEPSLTAPVPHLRPEDTTGPGSEPSGVTGPAPAPKTASAPAGIGDGGAHTGAADLPAGQAGTPAAAPALPEAVTEALAPLAATVAGLSQADHDAQRWPWLMPGEGYSDSTGSFAAICGEAAR